MDCSPPGSSVHEISQARILEWVTISFSRGFSWTRDWTCVSCIGRQVVYPRAMFLDHMVIMFLISRDCHSGLYSSCTIVHFHQQRTRVHCLHILTNTLATDAKSWLIRKDPDAGKGWRQEEKGTTEDEMAGWHHWLDGHEFEQAPGAGEGQGGLVCCSPWYHRVRHDWATEHHHQHLLLPFACL